MGRSSKPVNSDANVLILVFLSSRKNYRYCVLRTAFVNFIGLLLMRVYVTRRAKNSSILLNPRIISRYEKTPMPSNRHLVAEVLIPTQTKGCIKFLFRDYFGITRQGYYKHVTCSTFRRLISLPQASCCTVKNCWNSCPKLVCASYTPAA